MVLLHHLIGRIDAALPRILELTLGRLQVPPAENATPGDPAAAAAAAAAQLKHDQLKRALLQVTQRNGTRRNETFGDKNNT